MTNPTPRKTTKGRRTVVRRPFPHPRYGDPVWEAQRRSLLARARETTRQLYRAQEEVVATARARSEALRAGREHGIVLRELADACGVDVMAVKRASELHMDKPARKRISRGRGN